jgi:hypothetical protein
MKELDLVNKVNKHLGFETSKYIKVDPYVHPNWIFNSIYKIKYKIYKNNALQKI